jgi:hypothetical protein
MPNLLQTVVATKSVASKIKVWHENKPITWGTGGYESVAHHNYGKKPNSCLKSYSITNGLFGTSTDNCY